MKMNLKLKTLLVLSGTMLLAVPALRAQGHTFSGVRGGSAGRSAFAARPALASRSAFAARPANGAFGRSYRGTYGRGGYYGGHHGYGRYYYLGGVPYFYPFYGYGFGYGYGYGDSFYDNGFYGPGAYGGDGSGYGDGGYGSGQGGAYQGGDSQGGAYRGRITNDQSSGRNGANQNAQDVQGTGPSLPSAVQRQLAKRGYYKGTVDGQFGPSSREALKRFQKSQGLKATGTIDEDSLDALGFTDKHQ